jgi:hypothetical protein
MQGGVPHLLQGLQGVAALFASKMDANAFV